MKKTIGVLAHVDAGKTTFSESLLYHTNTIANKGRVDHQNSFLDTHEIEKNRGITIFADQAVINYEGVTYYLIDTPGHIDFTPEMERSIMVMDYAIVILSAVEGVQGHTETVWQLLSKYNVPTFFFVNKSDRVGADVNRVMKEIRDNLTESAVLFTSLYDADFLEFLALCDDSFMELYLEGNYNSELLSSIQRVIKEKKLCICKSGSALKDEGVIEFFNIVHQFTSTNYNSLSSDFVGRVYKIAHNDSGSKITHLKIMSGSLKVRDEIKYKVGTDYVTEKITKLQESNGRKLTNKKVAYAGDLIAATGLTKTFAGQIIGLNEMVVSDIQPTLKSRVIFDPSLNVKEVVKFFYQLNEEDPSLNVNWNESLQELHIQVMGPIQLEVLERVIEKRFNIQVSFNEPKILYKESILDEVNGYGHYEPYRHYAEIHLNIKAGSRNSGVKFTSICHVDNLNRGSQNLVEQHILEKEHKGMLAGCPLTDIVVSLKTGRIHNEHTSGGDIKQATLRALRQGLEKANNVLLEPYYNFSIKVNSDEMGRVLADVQKSNGEFTPPEVIGNRAIIKGRVPVATFMNYPLELRAFTGGKGMIQLVYGGYDVCHNTEEVVKEIAYNKDADRDYSSSSVFCGKGKTFNVPWYEAEERMHCLKK